MKRRILFVALAGSFLFSTAFYAQTRLYGITAAGGSLTPGDANASSAAMETIADVEGDGFNDLLVYPNPVTSSTRVVLDQVPSSVVLIDIINLNGVVVRSFEYAPGSYQLDVDMSNMPKGLYSVRVSGKDIGYHNLKVVKE